MPGNDDTPDCCKSPISVQWHEADELNGPETAGWCINLGGDICDRIVINFCPNCGRDLNTLTAAMATHQHVGWTGKSCPDCNGTGKCEDTKSCLSCSGTGDEYGPIKSGGECLDDECPLRAGTL